MRKPTLPRPVVILEHLEIRRLLSGYTFNATPFDSQVGTLPASNLVADAAGNLYGTLRDGGSNGDGAIFEFAKGSQAPTLLASFDTATNGASPSGVIAIDSVGDIFGTTSSGGGSFGGNNGAAGTIFELPHGQTTIQTLFSFGHFAALPNGVTLDPATGNLYVTTIAGGTGYDQSAGATGAGGVYELASGAQLLTSIGTFNAPITGSSPRAPLAIDTQGDLFGTASAGGAGVTPGGSSGQGYGTVFEIPHGTTSIVNVAAFSGDNGSRPEAPLLIDSAGDLFGEASQGGASFVANDSSQPGYGDVFKITAGSNSLNVVASFNNANGASPLGGLISDAGGNLFGTTYQGGDADAGSLFEIAANSAIITTLHSFAPSGPGGSSPAQSLYLDRSGSLWGVTESGGQNGLGGVLFDLSADGSDPFAVPTGSLSPALVKTTLPTSVIAGPRLVKTATVRVTNITSSVVKGRATVKLYLSASGLVDSDSTLIGTRTQTVNLKPNASVLVSVPIIFNTSSATATNLMLIARVIDPTNQPTDVTTGRAFQWAPAVVSFDILNLVSSPASVQPGKRVAFSLTLKNIGNTSNAQVAADRRVHGVIALSPGNIPPISFSLIATILAGKSKTLKFSAALARSTPAASYQMTVAVTSAASTFMASEQLVVE